MPIFFKLIEKNVTPVTLIKGFFCRNKKKPKEKKVIARKARLYKILSKYVKSEKFKMHF